MKYKLIKKLPFNGSPEIGYISSPHKGYSSPSHHWGGNWFEPKDYPEYWEEIKELDYEILEVIANPYIFTLVENNNKIVYHSDAKLFNYSLVKVLTFKNKQITKVRRLSDKIVFAIEDKTNNGTISKFKISGDMIRVYFEDKGNYHVNLNTLINQKIRL